METEHMEPFDLDKLIREKVLEEDNIHSREADNARAEIWTSIQDKTSKGRFISWYHLAASIALVIVSFTVILFLLQRKHTLENQELISKIESLEENYAQGESSIFEKDHQIKELTSNLNELESKLIVLSEKEFQPMTPIVIYKTDTVFVKTIEYMAYTPDAQAETVEITSVDENLTIDPSDIKTDTKGSSDPPFDGIIYPSPDSRKKGKDEESIKFRVGTIIAKNN